LFGVATFLTLVKLLLEIIELVEVLSGPKILHGATISKDTVSMIKILTTVVIIIELIQMCLLCTMLSTIKKIS